MKVDITQWDRKAEENLKGLNGAIQVHVEDSVLIMPQPGVWTCYFVTDEEETIVTRVGLNLIDCGPRSCPGLDSSFHADGRTDW